MDLSVLIPWRTDHGQRERVFEWVLPRWEQVLAGCEDVELVIGQDDDNGEPFTKARALNRAVRQSSGDVLAIYDADAVPDPDRLVELAGTKSWQMIYAESQYLSGVDTERVLRGEAEPGECEPEYAEPFQCGLIALRRECWTAIGGFDETFVGWGGFDIATMRVVEDMCGPASAPGHGAAVFLHHPIASRDQLETNRARLRDVYGQG